MSDSPAENAVVRRFQHGYRWADVEHKVYKEDGRELFRDVTRQVLFSRADLAGEMRYFEVAPGGFTTLERHEHVHAVLILRGHARVLVGTSLHDAGPNDLVTVPPMTWHQFRATGGEPMGFLCMVDAVRDKPQLPAAADEAQLKRDPAIAAYLSGV
ncbi:MAG: cupin domain-containing protein [Hyphomicrobiaceae bacterium]|nr:cupin domain-containing protein [Hyphomicrobiaceae bacterium]